MNLDHRFNRLEDKIGPATVQSLELTAAELEERLAWWIGQQTYHPGFFDSDPAFRPAWDDYHRLWNIEILDHSPHGYAPLHAVWVGRQPAELETARRLVVEIMARNLKAQPIGSWQGLVDRLLEQGEQHIEQGGATGRLERVHP
jgi:hypothetical protein